jgi:hypothetical protein
MMNFAGMEYINGRMETNMKANSKMIRCAGMEYISGRMGKNIKAILKIIVVTAMVSRIIKMVMLHMMVSGKMINGKNKKNKNNINSNDERGAAAGGCDNAATARPPQNYDLKR